VAERCVGAGDVTICEGSPGYEPLITDRRCAVCTSEHRGAIEMQLVGGMATKTLARFVSALGDVVSERALTAHWQHHMSSGDAALRRIWETRAGEAFPEVDEMEGFITTPEGLMEVLRERFKQNLLSGEVAWTPRDAIAIIDALERHRQTPRGLAPEIVMIQARLFVEAVRNILPEEMFARVIADYQHRLAVRDETIAPDDLVIAGVPTPPPGSRTERADLDHLDPTTASQ
jgi:hypothetical protein